MRHKISITVGIDALEKVQELLRTKTYRNKSHFFEIAALKLMQEAQ